MKKETMLKIALILLPVLAIGLATTVDSVTVFDTRTGAASYGSYFSLLPVGEKQMFAPLAGLLCMLVLVLAFICVVFRKTNLTAAVKWLAFGAMFFAACPIILRGEVLVVPHVGVPVFMGLEWVAAHMLAPKQKQGATLKNK